MRGTATSEQAGGTARPSRPARAAAAALAAGLPWPESVALSAGLARRVLRRLVVPDHTSRPWRRLGLGACAQITRSGAPPQDRDDDLTAAQAVIELHRELAKCRP